MTTGGAEVVVDDSGASMGRRRQVDRLITRFVPPLAAASTALAVMIWAYNTRVQGGAPAVLTPLELVWMFVSVFAKPIGASIALNLPRHALGRAALPASALPPLVFLGMAGASTHPLGRVQAVISMGVFLAAAAWAAWPGSSRTVAIVRIAFALFSLQMIGLWIVVGVLSGPAIVWLSFGLLVIPPLGVALAIGRVSLSHAPQ